FDGTPPYTATSTDPNVGVLAVNANTNPGRFTITALNPNVCLDHVIVVIQDNGGRRATVTVSTAKGTTTLPDLKVSPTTVSLFDTCGFTTSVTAVGGKGPLNVSSGHPRVSAVLSGSTVTITRALHDPASPPGPAVYPVTALVSVT